MDTIRQTIKKDTILLTNNKVTQQTTIEIKETNKCKECWNICDCKFLSDLLWPITTLIIITVFYKRLRKLIDTIGDRVKKGDKVKLSTSGIELESVPEIEKAESEFDSIQTDNNNVNISKQEFVPKYLQLERIFFELLMNFFYPAYKVLSNRRIGTFEYDIILEATKQTDLDYLFEVKFYPNKYNKNHLYEAILKLDLSKDQYIETTKRLAKPILIVVVQRQDFNAIQFGEIVEFIDKNTKNLRFMSTMAVYFDEFNSLTKDQILSLMRRE